MPYLSQQHWNSTTSILLTRALYLNTSPSGLAGSCVVITPFLSVDMVITAALCFILLIVCTWYECRACVQRITLEVGSSTMALRDWIQTIRLSWQALSLLSCKTAAGLLCKSLCCFEVKGRWDYGNKTKNRQCFLSLPHKIDFILTFHNLNDRTGLSDTAHINCCFIIHGKGLTYPLLVLGSILESLPSVVDDSELHTSLQEVRQLPHCRVRAITKEHRPPAEDRPNPVLCEGHHTSWWVLSLTSVERPFTKVSSSAS